MPHKKNPDVFEIIRAKCNRLKALPNEITIITNNLTTGYHRDLQLIKESFIPALIDIRECIQILQFTLQKIVVRTDILEEKKYSLLYSVEEVNRLVSEGMPFRDAYQKVAADIKSGKFEKPEKLRYTHEGSIGNLCNDKIKAAMEIVVEEFEFNKVEEAIKNLLAF
jgi:argininosuccinate lyase